MNALRSCSRIALTVPRLINGNYTGRRCISRWVSPTLREIVKRKKRQGPQPKPVRSDFLEWNHGAELYAFNIRLSEKFDNDYLLQALTFRSYVSKEEQKQRDVGIENPKLDIEDNSDLIEEGQRLTENIIKAYLCKVLPRVPEECIYTFLDYLMSQKIVAIASKHIGTKDLILTADHPIKADALACTFFALVSALARTPNVDNVHVANFVRDFLIAQLAKKDLTEIWRPQNPEDILNDILFRENRGMSEPRLIGQAGVNTLLAAYNVAFYSDKKFLGSGFGETVDEARLAAANNSIHRMFGLGDACKPIQWNLEIDMMSADLRTENLPLTTWCSENVNKLVRQ